MIGQGVTTLVTLFNCPLHSKYCINDFCHKKSKYGENVPGGECTPAELIRALKKDDIYYKMSDGGITFGGSESIPKNVFPPKQCIIQ